MCGHMVDVCACVYGAGRMPQLHRTCSHSGFQISGLDVFPLAEQCNTEQCLHDTNYTVALLTQQVALKTIYM